MISQDGAQMMTSYNVLSQGIGKRQCYQQITFGLCESVSYHRNLRVNENTLECVIVLSCETKLDIHVFYLHDDRETYRCNLSRTIWIKIQQENISGIRSP